MSLIDDEFDEDKVAEVVWRWTASGGSYGFRPFAESDVVEQNTEEIK